MKSTRIPVGTTWSPGLASLVDANRDLLDFVELSPDVLCRERPCPVTGEPTLQLKPSLVQRAIRVGESLPIVVHGLGLSIGSADAWNESYLQMLDDFAAEVPFGWHSEHLGFLLYRDRQGVVQNAGVPLPLPHDDEALSLLVHRATHVVERYRRPFLLENVAWYLPDLGEISPHQEPAFLNEVCRRSGAGLLLDLFNLCCNAQNHAFDPRDWLAEIEPQHIQEIHMAGGPEFEGFLVDVHSMPSSDALKALLADTLGRAVNVRGVVFELLEESADLIGAAGLHRELTELRQIAGGGRHVLS